MKYPKDFKPDFHYMFRLMKWVSDDRMVSNGYEIHFGNKIQHSTDGKRWRNISDRAIVYDFKCIYTKCNIWDGINGPGPDECTNLFEGDIIIVEDSEYLATPFTKIRKFLPFYGRIWWFKDYWDVVVSPDLNFVIGEIRPEFTQKEYDENSYITKNPGHSAIYGEFLPLRKFFGEEEDEGESVIARLLGNCHTIQENSIIFRKYQPMFRDIQDNIEELRKIDKDRVLFGRTLGRYFTKEILGKTLYYQITTISGWDDKAHITADICKGTFQGEINREMEQLTIKGDLFTARELVNTRKGPLTITDVLPDFYCPKNKE